VSIFNNKQLFLFWPMKRMIPQNLRYRWPTPFQEGKATFAHACSKPPFATWFTGQRASRKVPPWGFGKKSDWDRFIKNFDGSKFDSSAKAIKYTISINLQTVFYNTHPVNLLTPESRCLWHNQEHSYLIWFQ
jgi:hypothetical protein